MPYTMFYQYFPNIAKTETRNITIFDESDFKLPAGNYAFLEMFCNEPECDCRRVFLCVMSDRGKNIEAVFTYGWESPKFYAKWMKDNDPHIISELKGPALNLGSPQSDLAPALLDLVRNVLLRDKEYIDRIKRHYSMFRSKIDGSRKTKAGQSNKRKQNGAS
jgi:hypothetical protein